MAAPAPGNALVTGAALRIGRAIALALARDGWRVAIHHRRSAAAAREVADEIAASGGTAVTVAAELADHGETQGLVPAAAAALGPLTLLVNNAAVFERDNLLSATATGWDNHLAVNLRAPFFLTQAFARQLPPDAAGNVINIIDSRIWRISRDFASYTVSKAALWHLTQTAALELAPKIRVNAVGPGPVLPSARQTAAQFQARWSATPLKRGAEASEIAAAVRFIIAAPALTGQMIAIDGGEHLVAPSLLRRQSPAGADEPHE